MNGPAGRQPFQMIYVASCGEGFNAFNLVESTLVQFPDSEITVVKVPHIRTENQVDELIEKVKDIESLIVHTIVDRNLRQYITRRGIENSIVTIDLMPCLTAHSTSSIEVGTALPASLFSISQEKLSGLPVTVPCTFLQTSP